MKEFYSKGTRVWIPDPVIVWQEATVENDPLHKSYSGKLVIRSVEDPSKVFELAIKNDADYPPLVNPDILLGVNNLTSLSYLHEAAVLHNLRYRFCELQAIYTYCGIVLVAVNPYLELPLYGPEIMQAYSGADPEAMEPHIYAVAETALQNLTNFGTSQSIIISGESGAGKTVSAKHSMRYFATAAAGVADQPSPITESSSSRQTRVSAMAVEQPAGIEETPVERKVLASNPIMELFGNAKTTRNDNSSRFGKYIEIGFTNRFEICGAQMRTYLLEKSRVVCQSSGERNYHIFYQLCLNRGNKEYSFLNLKKAEEFYYTSQGKACSVSDMSSDLGLANVRAYFTMLEIAVEDQLTIFRVIASILHLGNVVIREAEKQPDLASVATNDHHLRCFCELMNVDTKEMATWLCNRKLVGAKETLISHYTVEQANFARDALAKHLYSQLFSWIVMRINGTLKPPQPAHRFIGVLDIYGFEKFEINSFEQFCINYANEKLQQQFNLHVFKLEQDEYIREGIDWSRIDFSDNQPCIDLFENKLGIVDLLDEECKIPKGSDDNWCRRILTTHLNKSSHLAKPRLGGRAAFVITHFADTVEYLADGFLDKNRDTVNEEQLVVLRNSKNAFVSQLVDFFESNEMNAAASQDRVLRPGQAAASSLARSAPRQQFRKSVAVQFRESLSDLMKTLYSTTPHYVRCVKPNDAKGSFEFDNRRSVQQLRACGVLETVRISSAGFPSRWTYLDFFRRYRVLAHSSEVYRSNPQKTVELIVKKFIRDEDKYRLGRTKVFFRAGQLAYLEKQRAIKQNNCVTLIQKMVRGFIARHKYQKIKRSVLLVQCYGRSLLAKRHATFLRQTRAATMIQKTWRGFLARRRYKQIRSWAVALQCLCRRFLAKRKALSIRFETAALTIQSSVRMWLARRRYKQVLKGFILIQNHWRRKQAKKELLKLRVQQRDVEYVRSLNKGLEKKIMVLQERLDAKDSDLRSGTDKHSHEIAALHRKIKELENELENARVKVTSLDGQIQKLTTHLEKSHKEKHKLESEINSSKRKYEADLSQLSKENESLKKAGSVSRQASPANLAADMTELSPNQALPVVLRLQTRVRELEAMNERLSGQLEMPGIGKPRINSLSAAPGEDGNGAAAAQPADEVSVIRERLRLAELEMENSRLRGDLDDLRKSVIAKGHLPPTSAGGSEAGKLLLEQLGSLSAELDRRRSECIDLKSAVLAGEMRRRGSGGSDKGGENLAPIGTDEDLQIVYRAVQDLNRALEGQLRATEVDLKKREAEHEKEKEQLVSEIKAFRDDMAGILSEPPQARYDKTVHQQLQKLASENLDLYSQLHQEREQVRRLKKHLKITLQRNRVLQQGHQLTWKDFIFESASSLLQYGDKELLAELDDLPPPNTGILSFRAEDIDLLIRNVVTAVQPSAVLGLSNPTIIGDVMFMCIRHTDQLNDDDKLERLFTAFVRAIRKSVKQHKLDVDVLLMWLANLHRFSNHMKQYSGEPKFMVDSSEKQRSHCLVNFDLSELRTMVNDEAISVFDTVLAAYQTVLQQQIVPCLLEYDGISASTGGRQPKRTTATSPQNGNSDLLSSPRSTLTMDGLLVQLSQILNQCQAFSIDTFVMRLLFHGLVHFVVCTALNNLMLRRELCNATKGLSIRFNLSTIEQWLRDRDFADLISLLEPLIQACHLLQSTKATLHTTVHEICPKLSVQQVVKILNIYDPVDQWDSKVPISQIKQIETALRRRRGDEVVIQEPLFLNTRCHLPVSFPFKPTKIEFDSLSVPLELNLDFLKRV